MLYYSAHEDLLDKDIMINNPKEIVKRLKT